MRQEDLIAVLILAVIVAGSVAGFIGYKYGHDKGYATGHQAGYDEAPKRTSEDDFYKAQAEKLTTDYNNLVNDYNKLRDAAVNYVNANQYQSRSPVTCNTYSYSSLN